MLLYREYSFNMEDHCGHNHCCQSHICDSSLIIKELVAHLPYAIFSVALALVILSFTSFFTFTQEDPRLLAKGAKILFHSFHYMHLVFAATGTIITYFRFARGFFKAVIIGILCPAVFCMFSDVLLPYLGASMLGVNMKLHICFIDDIFKVLPFLGIGILNGFIMSRHRTSMQAMYSVFSHSIHTLVSSLAATFYLVSHGFINWYDYIGFVFVFLIIAVVLPCSMSDVVVPILFARSPDHEYKKH